MYKELVGAGVWKDLSRFYCSGLIKDLSSPNTNGKKLLEYLRSFLEYFYYSYNYPNRLRRFRDFNNRAFGKIVFENVRATEESND